MCDVGIRDRVGCRTGIFVAEIRRLRTRESMGVERPKGLRPLSRCLACALGMREEGSRPVSSRLVESRRPPLDALEGGRARCAYGDVMLMAPPPTLTLVKPSSILSNV